MTGASHTDNKASSQEIHSRHLLDDLPVMVWVTDKQAQCMFLNRQWLDFTANTTEREKGEGWLENIHPTDLAEFSTTLYNAHTTKESFNIEYRLRHHSGIYRWMKNTGKPRFNSDGQWEGFIGTLTDITDLKASEKARQEHEMRLSFALDSGKLGDWDLDLATLHIKRTVKYDQIFGYSHLQAEWNYHTFLEHIHPEDRLIADKIFNHTLSTGEDCEFEVRIIWPDKSIHWIWLRGSLYKDSQGKPIRLIGVLKDITQRKQQEKALEVQSRLTKTITDNTTAALFMINAQGQCTFMNPAAEAMTGFTFEEVKGKALHSVIHHTRPDGTPYPKSECPIDKALQQNNDLRAHNDVFIHKDGTFFPVLCAASPIIENETLKGTVLEVRDITEEKRLGKQMDSLLLRERELHAQMALQAAQLNAIFHSIPDAIYIGNEKGITKCNQAALDLLGFENVEDLNRTISVLSEQVRSRDAKSGKRLSRAEEPFLQALQGQTVSREILIKPLKTDQEVIIRCAAAPIRYEEQIIGAVSINTDITETKRAEEALRYQSRLTRTITDNATAALFMMDGEGRCTYMNPAAEAMTGYTFTQLEGKILHDIVHYCRPNGSSFPIAECPIGKSLFAKQPVRNLEELFIRQDGSFFPVVCSASPIVENDIVVGNVLEVRDITQEKKVEQERKELLAREQAARTEAELQRSRLHNLFMQAPAMICVLSGPDFVFELVNAPYEELLGQRDLVGKSVLEALPEIDPALLTILKNVYTNKEPFIGKEFPIMLKWGDNSSPQERFFNFIYQPLCDENGQAEGILAFAHEVTDQVIARKVVEESAAHMRTLLESLPQMAWTTLPDGSVNYYNHRWYAYTGQTLDDAVGDGWKLTLHPDDIAISLEKYREALQTGKEFVIENRLKRASDGMYRWHLTRAEPIKNEAGEITLWVGTSTDTHDLKMATERVTEAQQQFQFLADFIPQMVWRAKPNGDHDYFNQQWLDYTGLSFEETKDKGWSLVLHPDDYQRALEIWHHSLETGDPYQIEYRFRKADGTYRWFLGRALPIKDDNGYIIKWFGTCTDIHDQRIAMEKLAEAQRKLHEKNNELMRINFDLDNFVYTASHDLKSPISNLDGLLALLTKKLNGRVTTEEEKLIEMIYTSINKLKRTILDLTQIIKAQKESEEEKEIVSLEEVIHDVKADIQQLIQESKATIQTDFAIKEIQYPRKNIRSIIYNLVSNAIKYRSPDRPVEVTIATQDTNAGIVLTVSDNGLGINKDQIHKLFTMFKRLHNHVEGSGIGLYIVKRIIENNGGRIEVNSEEGKGTTFTVYFRRK